METRIFKGIVIGLGHKIRTGKDTAAKALVRELGFTQASFANALKQEIIDTIPRTLLAYAEEHFSGEEYDSRDRADQINDLIYTNRTPVTRALLQEWGTELRRSEDEDYWVKKLEKQIIAGDYGNRVVITDMRFPNEAAMVRRLRGKTVRIDRPGMPQLNHPSETSLDDYQGWDACIINAGTQEAFEDTVIEMVQEWLNG